MSSGSWWSGLSLRLQTLLSGQKDVRLALIKYTNSRAKSTTYATSASDCRSLAFALQNLQVLLLGLDASGKTTLLLTKLLGKEVTTISNIGYQVEVLRVDGFPLRVCDVSAGTGMHRSMARHFYGGQRGLPPIIFIVDSAAPELTRQQVRRPVGHSYLCMYT